MNGRVHRTRQIVDAGVPLELGIDYPYYGGYARESSCARIFDKLHQTKSRPRNMLPTAHEHDGQGRPFPPRNLHPDECWNGKEKNGEIGSKGYGPLVNQHGVR